MIDVMKPKEGKEVQQYDTRDTNKIYKRNGEIIINSTKLNDNEHKDKNEKEMNPKKDKGGRVSKYLDKEIEHGSLNAIVIDQEDGDTERNITTNKVGTKEGNTKYVGIDGRKIKEEELEEVCNINKHNREKR